VAQSIHNYLAEGGIMANDASPKQSDVQDNSGVDISFVVAIFDDINSAKSAYSVLRDLSREGFFQIEAAAYLEKTDRSKIKVHEYKDWRGGQGALAGGTAGLIVGLIGGAVLLPVGVGALVGGILAKVHDTGFNDKNLGRIADSLPPGTSALVAIVEEEYTIPVEEEMKKSGGKKVHSGPIPKSALTGAEIDRAASNK
jgi:uncharacterized membrane protein